jgi:formate dehydrogenase
MNGGWDVAAIARNSFDLEGKVVGTLGCGRIGYRVLQRLKAFDCAELLYFDYAALPEDAANAVGCKRVEDRDDFLSRCDVITVNTPLHAESE